MTHGQLRAFHAVAMHGGFMRAARALGISQPALSGQVARLEQDHDVLLFRREGRTASLTPEGESLFALTKSYFEAGDRIAAQLDRATRSPGGRLRVMVDSASHIASALGAFRERHPNVFVQLTTGNSAQVLAALRAYDAEIGIVGRVEGAEGGGARAGASDGGIGSATDLVRTDLGTTPIVAIAAPGFLPAGTDSLSLDELSRLPLVFRMKGSRTRSALEGAARKRGVRLRPAMEVEGREAMREIVASGAGVGFVSEAELGQGPEVARIALAGVSLDMTETLVCLVARREVPSIRAFLGGIAPQ